MTYREAVQYLRESNRAFCKPGTQRVEELCARMGNPQRDLSVIHTAGTNGKGSFCVILASILTAMGYRVGRFSSPALSRINECITVDGREISDNEFAREVSRLEPIAQALSDRPTEFELLTVLAFLFFKGQNCDFVLLECGMGGLTDATNVIDRPLLSVITGVSVDHTSFLGNTVEEIAAQKAGIIKPDCPVLWCGSDPKAYDVVRKTAEAQNAPLYTVPKETLKLRSADLSGTVFDFNGRKNLSLSLLGLYQAENAANALTALDLLHLPQKEQALREGLHSARWPARFEVLSQSPTVIFDGGHNPQGVARTVESIKYYFPQQKVCFVSGVMADKDYDAVASLMAQVASRVYCVTPKNPRALPSETYAEVFRSSAIPAEGGFSVEEALSSALSCGQPVVCLGSLYLYDQIIKALKKTANGENMSKTLDKRENLCYNTENRINETED